MLSQFTNHFYNLGTSFLGQSIFPPLQNLDFLSEENKFLLNNENEHRRFLSHDRPIGSPLDGKNVTMKAITDPRGYCIEYRETLY